MSSSSESIIYIVLEHHHYDCSEVAGAFTNKNRAELRADELRETLLPYASVSYYVVEVEVE